VKVISSRQTFFIKKIFPVIWLGFLSVFTLVSVLGGAVRKDPVFLVIPVVMVLFGALMFRLLIWDLADEVQDSGDALIIRRRGVEDRILLSDVMNISMSRMTNPPRLSLRLRKPGKFGDEVSFIPPKNFSFNPFARHPLAEDLIQRTDRARSGR